MWNSPQCVARGGKRYQIQDIAALTYPLDMMLDFLDHMPVADVVDEEILQRMDREELVFALYHVFQAMLEADPLPPKGHPGYQEAIVAELLSATNGQIASELDDAEGGDTARKAAWTSLHRLCQERDANGKKQLAQIEYLKVDISEPRIHLSPKLTQEVWGDLILGDGGLWSEFLWDDDWRLDVILDLPAAEAKKITELAGIDLDLVQELPPSPTSDEIAEATQYLRRIISLAQEALEE